MIKLIATDLDDTLLQEDLTISPENAKAIAAVREKGVVFGIATGRVYESMEGYARELGLFGAPGFIICAGGGLAMETETRQILHQRVLSPALLAELLRFFDSHGVPVEVHHGNVSYASRDGEWVREDCRLAGLQLEVVEDLPRRVHDIPVHKILIADERDRIVPLLRETVAEFGDRVSAVISKPNFLEVLPPDVNKGEALRQVALHFGIAMEECMAIGDGYNDLEMIRAAGIGVVVNNGHDDVKTIASHVTNAGHNDSAVAEVIEGFVL